MLICLWVYMKEFENKSCNAYMCCNLAGSVRSLVAFFVRYSQKKKCISFVFYYSENPSIAHNLGTTEPIQVGFSSKCTSPNDYFNQIEYWKCDMFDFRLIPPDHITHLSNKHVLTTIASIFLCLISLGCQINKNY